MHLNRGKREYYCQRRIGQRRPWGTYEVSRPVCQYMVSQLKGTFFEGAKLSMQLIVEFVTLWLNYHHPRQHKIMHELDMSSGTVVDWSNYCREVCVAWLMENCSRIGGVGHVVEIDEAKMGHSKYNRGRRIEGSWIFGGIDRTTRETFLVPVPVWDAATLIPLIKEWVRPGSIIMSDMWAAYRGLPQEGFHHLIVNHSVHFVDPCTGANTQRIDRTWREVRGGVPRYGNRKHHLEGHLAEFLFKRKFGDNNRIYNFWMAVGSLYPGVVDFPPVQEGPEDDVSDIASSDEF